MKKYLSKWNMDIEIVKVERETKHLVIRKSGIRDAKRSASYNYFDSLQEAKDFIISARQEEISKLQERILDCDGIIDKTIKLTEDDLK